MTTDHNGRRVYRDLRKCRTIDGQIAWGINVWFGRGSGVSNVRRQWYRTRARARAGDISEPGDFPFSQIVDTS